MKKIIAILLLCAFFYGCKKENESEEENYTLTGIVRDFDSNTPIPGAKVYVKEYDYFGKIVDSALTDANGMVSITRPKLGGFTFLYPRKNNYLDPIYLIGYYGDYEDRTWNLFLARPSFINVTTHKTQTYLPSDTVNIQSAGAHIPPIGQSTYTNLLRDKAEAPDRLFNLQAAYGHLIGNIFYGSHKIYFRTEIIRNSAVISTKEDSTNVIQFSTQNFTLNY